MANQRSMQENILDAIQIMIDQAIEDAPFISSQLGKVISVDGFNCIVEIAGDHMSARMFEHLRPHIGIGDVVVVQSTNHSTYRRFIQSKVGSVS